MPVLELAALAVPATLFGAHLLGRWWAERRGLSFEPEAQGHAPDAPELGDRLAGPAYPWLAKTWTEAERALLVEVADRLELRPEELAVVMQLESGGDPAVPTKAEGTPRAGLIQVTVGANLPGLKTADAVWAVRSWPISRQLAEVVEPFFKRFQGRNRAWTAWDLYPRNFLPADVGKPLTHKVGVKDSDELVTPNAKLTRGKVYAANPGFDPEKKGYFTWGDVKKKVDSAIAAGGGKWVTVAGKILDEQPAPPPVTLPAPSQGTTGPTAPAGQVAPALTALLRGINDAFPKRKKASDGLLGDPAHNERCKAAGPGSNLCDHDEGRALDVTLDADGPDLDALAELLLADPRTKYVIWNKRIANPSIEGGAWRAYTGSNPHTRHLHVSIHEASRGDERPWKLPAARAQMSAPVTATLNLVQAWKDGLVDNVGWKELQIGPYRVRVATDALSVAGVRWPVSFEQVLELSKLAYYLPLTEAIDNARWAAATRRVVIAPLADNKGEQGTAKYPSLAQAAAAWSERIGPKAGAGELVSGPWKEWILTPSLEPGEAVNYGLRKGPDGSVWQKPGKAHNARFRDYSQLWAPVDRRATRDGVDVDLVDELRAGAPALMAGTLPVWLWEKLK